MTLRGANLDVKDLRWHPYDSEKAVLNGVSFSLSRGERVLLAGVSGSGKSTLLRAIAGVLLTSAQGELSGKITLDEVELVGDDEHASNIWPKAVGLLLQDPADNTITETVGRDVAFGPENLGLARTEIWQRVRHSLQEVAFPYGVDRATGQLSGGEAQRMALAGVLAMTPKLVLLDEPTAMLDPASGNRIRRAILDAITASGATAIVVEHQLSNWVDQVDRVLVMNRDGTIAAQDAPGKVLVGNAFPGLWVPGLPAPEPVIADTELFTPALKSADTNPGDWLVKTNQVSVSAPPPHQFWGGKREQAEPAVRLPSTSVTIRAGELVAIAGPSGSGKSTLTSLLIGMQTPTTGVLNFSEIITAGLIPNPASWSSAELAMRVGWVPQRAELAIVGSTIREDLLSGLQRSTAQRGALGLENYAAESRVAELLTILGLSELADMNPHQLSGGQLKRFALATALLHRPLLLVLDEPTAGQDRGSWAIIAGVIIAAKHAGVAVVVATHDPNILALADRKMLLSQQPIQHLAQPVETEKPRRKGLGAFCNPLSLIIVAGLLLVGSVFINNLGSALAGLATEAVLTPLVLWGARVRFRLLLPGLIAAASVGFSTWLLSSTLDPLTGVIAGLRIVFFVLPGVVLMSGIPASRLGDQLGQRLRMPARPVIAATAAVQRITHLGDVWNTLRNVRHIRGFSPSPARTGLGKLLSGVNVGKEYAALMFGMLVESFRLAERMTVAMESRGFPRNGSTAARRSWAEPALWGWPDWALLCAGLLAAGSPLLWALPAG